MAQDFKERSCTHKKMREGGIQRNDAVPDKQKMRDRGGRDTRARVHTIKTVVMVVGGG